jgi:exodeoxyribonuclease X
LSKSCPFPSAAVSVRIDSMGSSYDLFSSLDSGSIRVLFLDTETTGPDPSSAEICEVALILEEYDGFSHSGRRGFFQSLVRPSVPIPPEASAVNHISNRMVEGMPSAQELTDGIASLTGKADYIAAHNLPYDLTILKRQYPGLFSRFLPHRQIDTLRLSRHIWPEVPSHSLQALRYRFELDAGLTGEAHRALFDTELVQALLHHSLSQISPGETVFDWKSLAEFIQSPLEVKIFSFGKYRGNLVEDTVASDPEYIRWLLRQAWLSEEHPDLHHTILCKTGGTS